MSGDRIHILFSGSAAGTLRHVLRDSGSDDEVIHLDDNLSYGSIRSMDPRERYEALVKVGLADRKNWSWLPRASRKFWSHCATTRRQRILWSSSRSPMEAAGYHAYMHRFGDLPCRGIDSEEQSDKLHRSNGEPWGVAYGLGELLPHHIAQLLDTARDVEPEEASTARDLWERLVRENAALRIPGGEGLVSVPEDLVDERFLMECSDEWKPYLRVLADVLGTLPEERGFALDQFFLEWRLDRLLAQGALESREDIGQKKSSRFWRKAWIRRAQALP